MIKALLPLLGIGTIFAVSAATAGNTASREVAGRRFEIPKEYLFDATIRWLPVPETDSFVFLLAPNPNPNRIPDHRILVERLSRLCPTNATTDATQMLRIACGQEKSKVDDLPPYVHIQDAAQPWSSGLFVVGNEGTKRQVAYCQLFEPNPAKPEPSTLCTTFWAHNGLKLQFSFDLKEVPELPSMKAKAMRLLHQWEVS